MKILKLNCYFDFVNFSISAFLFDTVYLSLCVSLCEIQYQKKKWQKEPKNKNRCVLSSAGSTMRRGTPSDCHTDSNTSTTGGNNPIQAQQQTQQPSQPQAQQTQSQQQPTQQQPQQQQQQPANTQITTHPSYGEDDSSCDSHFLGKFAWLYAISSTGVMCAQKINNINRTDQLVLLLLRCGPQCNASPTYLHTSLLPHIHIIIILADIQTNFSQTNLLSFNVQFLSHNVHTNITHHCCLTILIWNVVIFYFCLLYVCNQFWFCLPVDYNLIVLFFFGCTFVTFIKCFDFCFYGISCWNLTFSVWTFLPFCSYEMFCCLWFLGLISTFYIGCMLGSRHCKK